MTPDLRIQTPQLIDELQQFASAKDASKARAYLHTLCEDAGLDVRVDAAGHTFARWSPAGIDPNQPAVGTGAHGGSVGVLCGLEAIRALQRTGAQFQHPIELVSFSYEDPDGPGPAATRPLADVQLTEDHYHAWVGLSREQGEKLKKQNAPIGIVMGIAGPATYGFHVTGDGGPAHSVSMPDRRDALCAAAETIHAIEQFARSSTSIDLTATVGQLDTRPGAVGAIPAEVRFTLELHDTDAQNRDQVAEAIHQECNTIALRRGLKITSEKQHAAPPAACDKTVIDAIEKACDGADLRWWKLVGGGYHDALAVARFAPTGMVLIPAGEDPDENPSPAEISAGVEVLALTLAELAGN